MIPFLSSPSDLQARKELTRLRMEMHRQQLRYHAQPLAHPLAQVKGFFGGARHTRSGRGPLVLAATLALSLFGRRLGRLGTLARMGLLVYPLLRARLHRR